MALSDPSIYASPVEEEDIKRKRRLLASALWQSRQEGLTPEEAFSKEIMASPSELSSKPDMRFEDIDLSPKEIGGFIDRLYSGRYDQNRPSTFAQQEQEARRKSEAAGAFGGKDWRGRSSEIQAIDTPNLDRLAKMQEEPVGFRPMEDSRRLITSEAGQARRIAQKAARAGIDPSKYNTDDLRAMGFKAGGITTQAERETRSELQKAAEAQRRKDAIEKERRLREEEEERQKKAAEES